MPAIIAKGRLVDLPASAIDEIKNINSDKIVVRDRTTFYAIDVESANPSPFNVEEEVFEKTFFLKNSKLRRAIEEKGLCSNTVDTIVGMAKYKLFTLRTYPEVLSQGIWDRIKYFNFISIPKNWRETTMADISVHDDKLKGKDSIATFSTGWIEKMGDVFWKKLHLEYTLGDGQNLAELICMCNDGILPEPPDPTPIPKYTIEEIIRALSLHSIKLDPKGLVEALHLVRKRIAVENELTALVDARAPFFKEGNEE